MLGFIYLKPVLKDELRLFDCAAQFLVFVEFY